MAFRSSSQMADITKPKHIPHIPCNNVSMMTPNISPLHVISNTRIMKISTSAVWPHITTNWVTTCEKRISKGVTPATHDRSRSPYKHKSRHFKNCLKYANIAYHRMCYGFNISHLCSFDDQCRRCQCDSQEKDDSTEEEFYIINLWNSALFAVCLTSKLHQVLRNL